MTSAGSGGEQGERITHGHLGGYAVGGDRDTWYPELWRWLVEALGVRSVLDVGCGEGQTLEFFRGLGCDVLGVEGIPQPSPLIVEHDYEVGPYKPRPRFDLVWACEFLEHVEERSIPNFLATFHAARRLLLVTHAFPGQGGHNHVNEREPGYWIALLEQAGFSYDDGLTGRTRDLAARNQSPDNHYRRSGLAFRRVGMLGRFAARVRSR